MAQCVPSRRTLSRDVDVAKRLIKEGLYVVEVSKLRLHVVKLHNPFCVSHFALEFRAQVRVRFNHLFFRFPMLDV